MGRTVRERFPQLDSSVDEETGEPHARHAEANAPCTPSEGPLAAGARTGRRASGGLGSPRRAPDLKSPVIHRAFGIGPLAWAGRPGRKCRR